MSQGSKRRSLFLCGSGIAFVLVLAWLAPGAARQEGQSKLQVLRELKRDVSAPLSTMTAAAQENVAQEADDDARWTRLLTPELGAAAAPLDPVLQSFAGSQIVTVGGISFNGIVADNGWIVPDTNSAAGATQLVEWVNTKYAVFNKQTGAVELGPVNGNTIWTGFGAPCETLNNGDPIVTYDKAAQRWVFSQHAEPVGAPQVQCLAVSTTSDAIGTYNRYSFALPLGMTPDYPKLAVWPDAYYLTVDELKKNFSILGAYVCALDRSAMLLGNPATEQCFQLMPYYSLLASDMDGVNLPPAGEPNYIFNLGVNALNEWAFHVDFANPANTRLTGPVSVPVAAFTQACIGTVCIPQPGTSQLLDGIGDRVMYRLAYRNFGDHESLVVNHAVVVGASVGVRWYEIRSPATPVIFQQGTYAPDANFRWMGSIAMDRLGDMALGYSVSSTSVDPAIRYTGRLITDPLNTMETEKVVFQGTGAETGSNRWGDYSSMAVDPSDDCTFWYSSEYLTTTGSHNWKTRVTSFRFPSCVATVPTATTLASSVNPSSFGQTVTFTATVTGSGGTPTGTVAFLDGTSALGSTKLSGAGQAAFSTATLALGSHLITAAYSGDSVFGGSTSPALSQLVGVSGGPTVTLSPASISFPVQEVGTTSASQTVTLSNFGGNMLNFSSILVVGSGDFMQGNTCGPGVPAGGSCTVTVTFTPVALGARSGTVMFTDNAVDSPQSLPLSGTGGPVPVAAISAPLVPAHVAPGSAGFTMTINGSGFVQGAAANWNGSARATTFVSSTLLMATILSSDLATAGTGVVTVTNPGVVPTSNAALFSVANSRSGVLLTRADATASAGPRAVIATDLRDNGHMDLAVANQNSNTVSILLGNGDGTFQAHVDYSTGSGSSPAAMITGDFNGDGNLDLAVANSVGNTVSIFLGNGDGTFQAHQDYATGRNPESVVTGDFNGDGVLDLAVCNFGDNTISVLLGNGDGTFPSHTDTLVGTQPASLAVGDLNGDGTLDLAVALFGSDTVAILLGTGNGAFTIKTPVNTGNGPQSVSMSDLNGDGKLDLVVANSLGNTVSTLLGNGDGTFQTHADAAVGHNPQAACAMDLNGDGNLDLLAVNYNDSTVSVLVSNGNGTYQTHQDFATASNPRALAIGDFNNDGSPDIATGDNGTTLVSVLLQSASSPAVSLSPSSIGFGIIPLNHSSQTKIATLTNTGTASLNISGISITGTDPGDFSETNTCPTVLAAGANCVISVTFKPTAAGGRSAAVSVADDAIGSPQSVALTGIGIAANVTPGKLTFAVQKVGTTSRPQTVTLQNVGATAITITSIILTGTNSGDFAEIGTCGSTLAAGASCTVNITFTPAAVGSRTALLDFNDSAPPSPQKVTLSGTGN